MDYMGGPEPRLVPSLPNDPWAIASLVAGLVAVLSCLTTDAVGSASIVLAVLLALAAVVCGVIGVARTSTFESIEIRRKEPSTGGGGLARAGLLLGAVGLFVILGLIPQLGRAREPAHRVRCGSNLRQIGQAMRRHEIDYPGQPILPMDELVASTDIVNEVFVCPSSSTRAAPGPLVLGQNCDYHYLRPGQPMPTSNTSILAACDPRHHRDSNGSGEIAGANVLFADGSVRFLDLGEYVEALVEQVAHP